MWGGLASGAQIDNLFRKCRPLGGWTGNQPVRRMPSCPTIFILDCEPNRFIARTASRSEDLLQIVMAFAIHENEAGFTFLTRACRANHLRAIVRLRVEEDRNARTVGLLNLVFACRQCLVLHLEGERNLKFLRLYGSSLQREGACGQRKAGENYKRTKCFMNHIGDLFFDWL